MTNEELEKLAREYADECDVDSHRGGPRRQAELSFIDGYRAAQSSSGAAASEWPSEVQDLIGACEKLKRRHDEWVDKNCKNQDGSVKASWNVDSLQQNIFLKLSRIKNHKTIWPSQEEIQKAQEEYYSDAKGFFTEGVLWLRQRMSAKAQNE